MKTSPFAANENASPSTPGHFGRFLLRQLLTTLLLLVTGFSLRAASLTYSGQSGLPIGNSMSGAAYGNNVYVVVGSYGYIFRSTDGRNWAVAKDSTFINTNYNSVVFAQGLFVAVAASGDIITSYDGANWSRQTSGTANQLSKVAYLNGKFFAIGASGTLLTSANGTNWTAQSLGSSYYLESITYGAGKYVMTCYDSSGFHPGVLLSSTTGTGSWTASYVSSSNYSFYNFVGWFNNKFYCFLSDASVWTSTDGSSWTQFTTPPIVYPDQVFGGIYTNGTYYFYGSDTTGTYGAVYTSTDGINFTEILPKTISDVFNSLLFANGLFIETGNSGFSTSQTDAGHWRYPAGNYAAVAYNGTNYVAVGSVGSDGFIATSPDWVNWTNATPATRIGGLTSVASSKGKFVAVGYVGNGITNTPIISSTDGTNWTQNSFIDVDDFYAIATDSNGTFVAVGDYGHILRSTDNGVTWSTNATGTTVASNGLYGVSYINSQFVAVGYGGVVLYSANGSSWSSANYNSDPYSTFSSITYGSGGYVMVGTDGNYNTIYLKRTSLTSGSWAAPTTPPPSVPYSYYGGQFVTYANGLYVSFYNDTNNEGYLLTSSDGNTWVQTDLHSTPPIFGITFAAGSFRLVGSSAFTGLASFSNIAPTFVGTTTTLLVGENASATDITGLLHVSDTDSGQTETWSQSSAPSHGSLSFSGATASSGSANIAPGGTITYAPAANYSGSDSFAVQVSDGNGGSAIRNITVTVNPPTGITSALTANGTNGSPFTYTITASNNPTSFGASGLPTGLSVNAASGVISGTPSQSGSFPVTISATNATSYGTATLTLTIVNPNTPPTFVGTTTTLLVGENASATDITGLLHVSDTDSGQTETWSQNSAPSHGSLSFSGATASSGSANIAPGGTITYAPAANYSGSDSFAVQVSDGNGGTAIRTITVTVNPPTGITSALTANGTNGSPFTYTITASNNPTSFGASGLPTGLSVNMASGVISGIPSQYGNFPVTLSATNATSYGTATLTLAIVNSNMPPVFVGNTTTLLVGENASATDITGLLHVSDTDSGQTETWSQNSAPAHGSLSFSGATASSGSANIAPGGTITYAPTTNYSGSDSFAVQVSDGNGGSAIRTITVTVNPPTGITSALTGTGTYGSAFAYTITASNNPTSFGASGLPTGLRVNTASGVISGTPTQSGNFPVTLSATNATSFGTATLTLNIAKVNLTVTGITASNKVYDGNTMATLNLAGASLNGVVNGDSISLNTTAVTASFADSNAGTNKTVTIAGLGLSGVAAGNYTLTQPSASANITPTPAVVTLHRSVQLYNGSPKTVTATTLPLGLAVSLTYDGSPTQPSNTGAYTVVGTVTNPNYSGSATNYLYVVTAPQFTDVTSNGTSIVLSWTAMPQVNYQVVYTPSLSSTSWTNLGGQVSATNTTMTILDVIDQTLVSRFYRVKVILQ